MFSVSLADFILCFICESVWVCIYRMRLTNTQMKICTRNTSLVLQKIQQCEFVHREVEIEKDPSTTEYAEMQLDNDEKKNSCTLSRLLLQYLFVQNILVCQTFIWCIYLFSHSLFSSCTEKYNCEFYV